MPDRNDFFGSGARSEWTRQPVSAPRTHLSGTSTGLPAASDARPSLDAPQYDQSHYSQGTYDQTPYDQTHYDQPRYDQSQYAAHYDQPHYDQPHYDQPHYDQPQYEQSHYDQPQYGATQYDAAQPGYEQSGHEPTGYAQPQAPAYESSYPAASYDPTPAAAVGGYQTAAEPEPEPVQPEPVQPERGSFGKPGSTALDWTELTGAGNGRQADGHQESTPIFDALVSAWFRKGSSLFSKDRKSSKSGDQAMTDAATEPDPTWPSPADQGWQAADAVANSKPDSFTTSGLPRRTPSARLLPGSMAGQNAAGRHLDRKPEELRSRLSEFQRGSNEGRHNVGTKRWTPVWDENGERESG